jgi:Tol biopolymer transport system component
MAPNRRISQSSPPFSPDGNYLYFVRSDKNDIGYRYLYVMPALGGPARKLIADIDSSVSFSPDGRQFLFTRGIPTKDQIQVRIANPDGTADHLLTTMEESDVDFQPGATWSPDGRTAAVPVFHTGKRFKSALYGVSITDGLRRELYSTNGNIGRRCGIRMGAPCWFLFMSQASVVDSFGTFHSLPARGSESRMTSAITT